MEDDNLSKEGPLEVGYSSNGCAISTGVDNFLMHKPFFKGSSNIEIEYDMGSEEDFKSVDELDNVDQRCISQSANALLGKAKGVRGRRSNRQVREARANEKGIVEAEVGLFVVDYIEQFDPHKGPIIWKIVGIENRGKSLKLAEILKCRKIHISNEADTLIWNVAKSGIVSNNVAEVTALEEGLNWVIANDHRKVVIEGDSQIILNGVTKKSFTNWRLNERIPRIDQLIQNLEDYQVKHIFHEGNCVADLLAN
ncbi:hypothetical protein SUGI_0435770 [Cryptomeria japonica]|nr:hypothetical protein SUGI_0435770 [Cryptomeria japonica]